MHRLVALITAALALTACSAATRDDEMTKRAVSAGNLMSVHGGHLEEYTSDAAFEVVGSRDNVTIEALEADGTTFGGQVILRITVVKSGFTERRTTGCFEYQFADYGRAAKPMAHLAHCPGAPALVLATPADPPLFTSATADRIRSALVGLSGTQRADSTLARNAIQSALGHGYFVHIRPVEGGQYSVSVTAGDQCVLGSYLPAGATQVDLPRKGDGCTGG